MIGSRFYILTAALALGLVSPSCRLFRKPAKVAAPPAQAPTLRLPEPQQAPPAALDPPPEIPAQSPDLSQSPVATPQAITVSELPPRPRTPRGKSNSKKTEIGEAQAPEASPDEPSAAVPQLEEVLTPEQQQSYNAAIDRDIGRAQQTVDTLSKRRLNEQQTTYLERIRMFIVQANDARKTDLFRAKNLAERASVLAEDLQRSSQ
jgi:hypothetical protein